MVERKNLAPLEADIATAAGERRDGVRLLVTGKVVFMGMRAVRTFRRRDGTTAEVLPFVVYAGERASVFVCEVSDPDLILFVASLVEGEPIALAGQVVAGRGRWGSWARVRCSSVEHAQLRPQLLNVT